MARIRSVKPDLRTSEKVNSWPIELRFFWVLLWGYCDDYGRGKLNPRLIVADAFPLDDTVKPDTVSSWMDVLAKSGVITPYEVDDVHYFYVTNWSEHQKVQHPSKSATPCPHGLRSGSCNSHESSVSGSGESHPRGEGEKEEEKEGEIIPPPRRCKKHEHVADPPNCVACRDARLTREDWDARLKDKPTPTPPRVDQLFCARHPGMPLKNCERCAAEAKEAS